MKSAISKETLFSLSRERTRLVYQAIIQPNRRRKLKREIEKLNVKIEALRGEK